MARVTYVKRAQQRYPMVPVLDDQGQPKKVAVLRKDGTPKTTKTGRPIERSLTIRDTSKPPLPNYVCGNCKKEILPGQPYKWIEPQSRGFMVRCMECPNWNVWEYSSSLSARVAQIQDGFDVSYLDNPEDVRSALEDMASQVRELAEEKREGAQNMEDGFGHSTYQSDELNETADALDGWADEIENADIPDLPEPEETDCEECEGSGEIDGAVCPECQGDCTITPDEPTDDQMDEWREAVTNACSVTEECPV